MTRSKKSTDYTLLVLTFILVSWGLIMVYSASAIMAERDFGNSLYFLKRQLLWAVAGLLAMGFFSRLDFNRLEDWVWPIYIATVGALALALLGHPIAGVRRWIKLGPMGIQPAEFAKITNVVFLAAYMDRKHSKASSPFRGLVLPGLLVLVLLALIAKEPDIGTPALMFAVTLLVLFAGGARLRHVAGALACAIPVLAYELMKYSYRRQRLLSFMNPFSNIRGAGYQLSQAILAVGSGGWFGKGLGASRLKLMYLPAPHTDFIFPILCEELGLVGALAMLAVFVGFLWRGTRIARKSENLFGMLLAAGITFTIVLQAFLNIGMAIGLLPTKGIPLPFISFGGSSLLATLIGVGILLNISRHRKESGA